MGILGTLWRREARTPRALTAEQRRHWDDHGYLVLRQAIAPTEVAAVRAIVDDEWAHAATNDHEIDVLTGPHAHRAFRLSQAPEGARREAYKLNNLFARRAEIRRVALSPAVRAACEELLEGDPLICNSLNFERGSQQAFHIDTWYMPPPVEGRMVVASIAIDGVDADNGPIALYPGSHRIPPYRFSHGRLNEIPDEGPHCREYLDREIAARGLQEHEVHMASGDVLLWHAQLLHGGRPIRDMSRTRSSLVVHYWRAQDLPAEEVRHDPASGHYLGRTLRGEITF